MFRLPSLPSRTPQGATLLPRVMGLQLLEPAGPRRCRYTFDNPYHTVDKPTRRRSVGPQAHMAESGGYIRNLLPQAPAAGR